MAITVVESTVGGNGFALNGTSADLSGCEALKAAPGASRYIYIESIVISCAADATISIGAGETTGALTTVIIGPITFKAAGGNNLTLDLKRPIKLAANTALCVDGDAGVAAIFIEGYVGG